MIRPEREAAVALLRASDAIRSRIETVLKPLGLSPEQADVLAILRAAPDRTLPTLEIAARMVARAPNITRLIDKLIGKGLVTRCPLEEDRRVVQVRLTGKGAETVEEISPAADRAGVDALSCLSPKELKLMIRWLDRIRSAGP